MKIACKVTPPLLPTADDAMRCCHGDAPLSGLPILLTPSNRPGCWRLAGNLAKYELTDELCLPAHRIYDFSNGLKPLMLNNIIRY